MKRITKTDLDKVVERINRYTNSPMETYTKQKNGKFIANVGNYHLDSAYGGHRLVRMHNPGGGINVITSGFVSKRELYNLMQAFIRGLEAHCE